MELEDFTQKRRRPTEKFKTESNVDISIPGLARLTNPSYKKKKKMIWMIIVIICATACLYLTIDRLMHYFQVPTASKIDIQQWDNEIKFPQFTVCSTNLAFGFRNALQEKFLSQCVSFGLSDCSEEALNELSIKDLDISVMDVWEQYQMKRIEIELMGWDKPINIQNVTEDNFEIVQHTSLFGDCVMVQHNTEIPYLSSATHLKLIIEEQLINPNIEFFYVFIPHGVDNESINSYEFLSNEFAMIPQGLIAELTLETSEINLINSTGQLCYDEIEENIRLQECVENLIKPSICRSLIFPIGERECNFLQDFFTTTSHSMFYEVMKMLRKDCWLRDVCSEYRHHTVIDYVRPARNKNRTELVIKMAESIKIIKDTYAYTFPSLVSDLFAYWGFFLSLSALVFVEIFEFLITRLSTCITNCKKKRRKQTQY